MKRGSEKKQSEGTFHKWLGKEALWEGILVANPKEDRAPWKMENKHLKEGEIF